MSVPLFDPGQQVAYVRNNSTERLSGLIEEVFDVYLTKKYWPKPIHCQYVYRLTTKYGGRTVCECRLTRTGNEAANRPEWWNR